MPVELKLPRSLKQDRWKVKIQEKEILEPPHVSILRRTSKWRINLRTGKFMDAHPDPSEVPEELVRLIFEEEVWLWLCAQWDLKYPSNRVGARD